MENRVDLLVRIAELYYQQSLSQQEISTMMKLSRPTISRLLDEAKEAGVVEIIVHSPITKHPQLSRMLRNSFGLRDALVISGNCEFQEAINRCARSTVHFLRTILTSGMSIGLSWGSAMEEICRIMEPGSYENIDVVQMAGCLGLHHPRMDGPELAVRLSEAFGGRFYNLYAPIYVDSEPVYSALLSQPQIGATMQKAMSVNVILTSIGAIDDPNSSLYQSGCCTAADYEALCARGAVANLLGRWIDLEGHEITLPNHYVISTLLEAVRTPDWVIGIHAGAEHAAATLAAVNGEYVNTLIVDEPLARQMLKLAHIPFP